MAESVPERTEPEALERLEREVLGVLEIGRTCCIGNTNIAVVKERFAALRSATLTDEAGAATGEYDEGFRRGIAVARERERSRTLTLVAQYVREEISTGKLAEMLEIDQDDVALRDLRDAVQGPAATLGDAQPEPVHPRPFTLEDPDYGGTITGRCVYRAEDMDEEWTHCPFCGGRLTTQVEPSDSGE